MLEKLADIGNRPTKQTTEVPQKAPSGRLWALYLGLFINIVLGPSLEMGGYAFAAQSLLAPFGGLDTVWNALTAPYTLGEPLTRRRLIGVATIVLGTVGNAIFGNHDSPTYNNPDYYEDIFVSWRTWGFILGFLCWFSFHLTVVCTSPPKSLRRGLSLGLGGGSLAGNMYFVKITMSLLAISFQKPTEVWGHWLIYVTLILAAAVAVTNAIMLTKGLEEMQAQFMVPLFEGSQIISSAASGCVVIREMDEQASWQISGYWCFISIVLLGLVILVSEEFKVEKIHADEAARDADAVVKEPEAKMRDSRWSLRDSSEDGGTSLRQSVNTALHPPVPLRFRIATAAVQSLTRSPLSTLVSSEDDFTTTEMEAIGVGFSPRFFAHLTRTPSGSLVRSPKSPTSPERKLLRSVSSPIATKPKEVHLTKTASGPTFSAQQVPITEISSSSTGLTTSSLDSVRLSR